MQAQIPWALDWDKYWLPLEAGSVLSTWLVYMCSPSPPSPAQGSAGATVCLVSVTQVLWDALCCSKRADPDWCRPGLQGDGAWKVVLWHCPGWWKHRGEKGSEGIRQGCGNAEAGGRDGVREPGIREKCLNTRKTLHHSPSPLRVCNPKRLASGSSGCSASKLCTPRLQSGTDLWHRAGHCTHTMVLSAFPAQPWSAQCGCICAELSQSWSEQQKEGVLPSK